MKPGMAMNQFDCLKCVQESNQVLPHAQAKKKVNQTVIADRCSSAQGIEVAGLRQSASPSGVTFE